MVSNKPETKTIVIFAKSIKHQEYCVAGKDIVSKAWIRLVSDENGSELSQTQCKCTNDAWIARGNPPYSSKVLYKVELEVFRYAPLIHQPENHIVSDVIWQHKYAISQDDIQDFLDNPESIWGDDDRVDYLEIENNLVSISQSLYLLKVDNLNLYKNENDKRRVSFAFKNVGYDLSVTDPNFDNILESGSQNLQSILCVSLGESFNGFCFKIVAAIY